jgi:gluconolactonase
MDGTSSMEKALRRYGVIAMILAGAVLSIGSPSGAFADSAQAVVVATDLLFPEGTIFVGHDLYFVDYARSDVLRLVGAKTEVVWHQDGCGANGLVAVPDGLLVACFDAAAVVKISLRGATLTTIRRDAVGQAFVAPNDFAADQNGGLFLSDSGSSGRPGKVYYLSSNGVVREVASGIRFANGIGVSPDGSTLYVAESPTGKVLTFPIGADGFLGPVRDLIRLRDVLPIVSPGGRVLKLLHVPSQHHTNLAISPDEESLYVTAVDDDARSAYRGQIVRMANPLAP